MTFWTRFWKAARFSRSVDCARFTREATKHSVQSNLSIHRSIQLSRVSTELQQLRRHSRAINHRLATRSIKSHRFIPTREALRRFPIMFWRNKRLPSLWWPRNRIHLRTMHNSNQWVITTISNLQRSSWRRTWQSIPAITTFQSSITAWYRWKLQPPSRKPSSNASHQWRSLQAFLLVHRHRINDVTSIKSTRDYDTSRCRQHLKSTRHQTSRCNNNFKTIFYATRRRKRECWKTKSPRRLPTFAKAQKATGICIRRTASTSPPPSTTRASAKSFRNFLKL